MSKLAHSTLDYRGWSISWDYGQFTATGPDYEPDYNDEDGFFNPPGAQIAYGRTLESVRTEIDAWFAEHGGAE
jgi:hypothetical protein